MRRQGIMHLYRSLLGYVRVVTCLILIFLPACAPAARTSRISIKNNLQLEDCQLSMPTVAVRLEARCGNLSVAEDPRNPQGKQILLNLAVIPAVSRSPAPDPIFFIPGGPGEAATESYLGLSGAFALLNQKRDIVLVDQRGTGGSNPLDCKFTEDDNSEQIDLQLRQCLNELDADPRLYTTAIAMDDLDQVRQVLGYDQINLYGASYGTRAALAYLRQHPEKVRTLILDGVVPPGWVLGASASADAQRALDALFARCDADPECKRAFPDLAVEFKSLLSELEQAPSELVLEDPVSGETISFLITRDRFANTIHLLSYSSETASLIPLLVHTTFIEKNFKRLASVALSYEGLLGESLSSGMRFSIICAEDAPYFDFSATQTGYLGEYVMASFEDICAIWPRGVIPGDFGQPVRSDVPVLLLSGEYDPVTLPGNAEMAMRNLANSLHLVVPGMGHINLFRGCIPRIATEFIESGTLQYLDTDCIKAIQPAPFFINFNGPVP